MIFSPDGLKVVFISALGPHHSFIISHFLKRVPVSKIYCPEWSSPRTRKMSPSRRLKRLIKSPFTKVANRINQKYATYSTKVLNEALRKRLPCPNIEALVEKISVDDLNSTVGEAALQSLQPDLVIVAGAPVLEPRIFKIAKLGTINLHYGHIPKYRGQNNIFFALRAGRFKDVAVTIHHVTPVLDGGNILLRLRPRFLTSATEVEIIELCTRLTARMLTELVEKCLGDKKLPPGLPIDALSAEVYRFKDRTPYAELTFKRPTVIEEIPALIEWFNEDNVNL